MPTKDNLKGLAILRTSLLEKKIAGSPLKIEIGLIESERKRESEPIKALMKDLMGWLLEFRHGDVARC